MKVEIERNHVIAILMFFVIITMVWAGAYLNEHYSTTTLKYNEFHSNNYIENVPFFFSSYGTAYTITFVAILIFLASRFED